MEAVGFAVLLIIVLAVVFFLLLARAARAERQIAAFRVSAAKGGWQERTKGSGPAHAPRPPTDALPVSARHSPPRLMIMMERQVGGHQVWMTWHRWKVRVPSAGLGEVDRTRYLLSLGTGRYPDMTVARRKALGGLFRQVLGRSTGDPVFDRAFRVAPARDADARRLLTGPLRQAMLAGALPPWRIRDRTLITTYPGVPAESTHRPRAEAICIIANHFTAGS